MLKKILPVVFLLSMAAWPQVMAQDSEIIIHMTGKQNPPPQAVRLWDKNAKELTKIFRGKTREEVLYSVENVSDKDGFLTDTKGKKYAFVQYGSANEDYRKFIFQARDPQLFVACAADTADTLAIYKKYKVNLGLTEDSFTGFYKKATKLETLSDLEKNKQYTVYSLLYDDINNKTPSEHYFLFVNEQLDIVLENKEDFVSFKKKNEDKNNEIKKQMKQNQQTKTTRKKRISVGPKALVSGGTLHDQMYMPRVISSPHQNQPVPEKKSP